MSGWGVVFADLDNDGWKDIAVARSGALSAMAARGAVQKESLSWFRNLKGRQFVAGTLPPMQPEMHRGLVAADFDGDGCLDLVATALNASAKILRNACTGNWLQVTVPSAAARVRVGSQWRHVTSAVGYASSCACPLHFGLGAETRADIEVFWPDGRSKFMRGVKANQTLVIAP